MDTIVSWSILIGLFVDLALVGLLFSLRTKWKKGSPKKGGWISLIAEEDCYPSLARFQLLIWTLIVIFAFVTVSMIRIFSGVSGFPTLSTNVLTLLGINAGSPVVSAGVSRGKYAGISTENQSDSQGYQPLHTMTEENGIFSVTRYQMLSWTVVGLIIFVVTLAGVLASPPADLSTLNPPDVSSTLISLSAVSQGVYLVGKGVSEPDSKLRKP